MKLTYQTGIATLIQLVLFSVLTIVNQIFSTVSTCSQPAQNCVGNIITSIIFYLLVAIGFGGIWVVGLAAQATRNKWLAWLLIGIESVIVLVALFSLKLALHQGAKNLTSLLASPLIAALAIWIIVLAWRLMRSEGKRIRRGGRGQRRRRSRNHTDTGLTEL